MDRLWGLYEHWCMEELISLREFITRLKTGEFGAFNRDDVVGLLREIECVCSKISSSKPWRIPARRVKRGTYD